MNPEDEIKINGEIYIRKGANKKGEVKITAEDMRELLCSLTWAPWSACHYENAKRLLKSFFPGANWGDALENFTEIILMQFRYDSNDYPIIARHKKDHLNDTHIEV